MARLSQNTLRTVRFYEEAGLLLPMQRTGGGHRLFPMRELKKLMLITDLRAAGFALEEIRDILELKVKSSSGATASREVLGRLKVHVDLMNARIALLRRLSTELDSARLHLTACTRCEDASLFPTSCGNCTAMKRNGALPDAVGVLWGVDT